MGCYHARIVELLGQYAYLADVPLSVVERNLIKTAFRNGVTVQNFIALVGDPEFRTGETKGNIERYLDINEGRLEELRNLRNPHLEQFIEGELQRINAGKETVSGY